MQRFLRPALATFASLALGAVVACSSSSTASPGQPAPAASGGPQAITVQGTDTLKFEPATLTVKAGQPVQLSLKNTGQTLHDWSLNQGTAQPVKVEAAGGQTASATFTIDKPGTYTYVCSQPGHESAGMKGTITAQ